MFVLLIVFFLFCGVAFVLFGLCLLWLKNSSSVLFGVVCSIAFSICCFLCLLGVVCFRLMFCSAFMCFG